VVVLPFFIVAIGIIAYGASIYTLSMSAIPDFPQGQAVGLQYLAYTLVGGLLCALIGVYIQSVIRRWQGQGQTAIYTE
jgi:putative membrane protein